MIDPFSPTHGLVRELPNSFEKCLKQYIPDLPIDQGLAKQQHDKYVEILRAAVPNLTQVEADPSFPDCCFIEDTAVIVGDTAVISFMGAPERRGEESLVKDALEKLAVKNIHVIKQPGTLDGGDVLYTGKHLWVGISKRTNSMGFQQLQEIFGKSMPVHDLPVAGSLHLKSVVSALDTDTLLVADCEAGRLVVDTIQSRPTLKDQYTFVFVPDSVASNVLRVGNLVLFQEGYPESERIIVNLCNKKNLETVRVCMSELIKADAALTCCSLLFSV